MTCHRIEGSESSSQRTTAFLGFAISRLTVATRWSSKHPERLRAR